MFFHVHLPFHVSLQLPVSFAVWPQLINYENHCLASCRLHRALWGSAWVSFFIFPLRWDYSQQLQDRKLPACGSPKLCGWLCCGLAVLTLQSLSLSIRCHTWHLKCLWVFFSNWLCFSGASQDEYTTGVCADGASHCDIHSRRHPEWRDFARKPEPQYSPQDVHTALWTRDGVNSREVPAPARNCKAWSITTFEETSETSARLQYCSP